MDLKKPTYFEMNYSCWLHNAILTNDIKRIEDILSANRDLNTQYYNQQSTPLRHAILQCNPDIVGLLLKYRACPNHKLDDGLTAFHYAVKTYGPTIRVNNLTSKLRVLLKLLRAGAIVDEEIQSELAKANYTVEGIYLKEHIPYTTSKACALSEQSAKACALSEQSAKACALSEQSAKACSQSVRPDTPLPESLVEDLYT